MVKNTKLRKTLYINSLRWIKKKIIFVDEDLNEVTKVKEISELIL